MSEAPAAASAAPSPAEVVAGTGGNFILESFSPVFVSSWERDADICSICRNNVEGPCVVCQSNAETANWECPIAWGKCNHAFHAHCVNKWLRTRQVCPLDNKPWEEHKEWSTAPQ